MVPTTKALFVPLLLLSISGSISAEEVGLNRLKSRLQQTSNSPFSSDSPQQIPTPKTAVSSSRSAAEEQQAAEKEEEEENAEATPTSYDSCEVWQDLRMLLSSALGFLLTHWVSTSLRGGVYRNQGGTGNSVGGGTEARRRISSNRGADHGSAVFSDSSLAMEEKRKFKLYCYAM